MEQVFYRMTKHFKRQINPPKVSCGSAQGTCQVDKKHSKPWACSKKPGGAVSLGRCWEDVARTRLQVHHTPRHSSVFEHGGHHFQLPFNVLRPHD